MKYVPLLIASILFNYGVGRYLESTRSIDRRTDKRAEYVLLLGIGTDLLLLGYFKYYNFFIDNLNSALHAQILNPSIILPLGISFFTFTQIAYLADAYRGETKKYSLLSYSLFVTFFPHLIAGPLLQHKNVIPQFRRLRSYLFRHKNFAMGLTFFALGLFKKVIIADTVAQSVSPVFDNAASVQLIESWIGALAYTLQIYFDFSGYCDMAIGLGLLLNIKLPINFNSPYQSLSIIDFWRRWHITLSTFLKDYLYIPLGGNRKGHAKRMRNLLITMMIGGLWHGAGWTFIIWGTLHGVYLVINHTWKKFNIRLPKIIAWLLTFGSVMLAWIFFRAHSVAEAWHIVQALVGMHGSAWPQKFPTELLLIVVLLIGVVYVPNTQQVVKRISSSRWGAVLLIVLAVISMLQMNKVSEFLYFQF
ncbi:MBOAT family O-acyltransferase [Cohnella sp. GCM10027633]|uniref:MBOAT family O-acyltransferase n=1 Tax=unclassified Cohnella TaxID=2636738 RepID=UPI00362AB727